MQREIPIKRQGRNCSARFYRPLVITTARGSRWRPTFPELVGVLPGVQSIDRSTVNRRHLAATFPVLGHYGDRQGLRRLCGRRRVGNIQRNARPGCRGRRRRASCRITPPSWSRSSRTMRGPRSSRCDKKQPLSRLITLSAIQPDHRGDRPDCRCARHAPRRLPSRLAHWALGGS